MYYLGTCIHAHNEKLSAAKRYSLRSKRVSLNLQPCAELTKVAAMNNV